ncbi:MAG: glutathione peroxidase [Burkholderiales bacterium]|nr:glutathione peroxidase [Phycisphaerae bacterium]
MPAATQPASAYTGPLQYQVKDVDGNNVNLADHRGKVVLIVNVASKCGFTKQYTALEALNQKYKDRGLVIIGFPANNFKGQEPGTDLEIKAFCTGTYNVTFPIMSKISVKGDDKHPLYKFLTEPTTAGDFAGEIGWNFSKFLIDRTGQVYARYASAMKPDDPEFIAAIEKALGDSK